MTYDSYGNLTKTGVADYLKEKAIFPADANLTVVDLHAVKESIEGFVNLIYHVYDQSGKSVVMKQMLSMPRFRIEDEKNNTVEDSNRSEWTLDIETYLIDQLQNALSYTGVNVMSRLANRGICYDFLRLPEANRLVPCLSGMELSKELMLNHRSYTNIKAYTQLLKNLV